MPNVIAENIKVHATTTLPAAAGNAIVNLDSYASIATIIAAVFGIAYTVYSAVMARTEHRKKMELMDKQILPPEAK
jgi:hypothetical protein